MDTLRDKRLLDELLKIILRLGEFGDKIHFLKKKKFLITGHTGFKGSWLTIIFKSFRIRSTRNLSFQDEKLSLSRKYKFRKTANQIL